MGGGGTQLMWSVVVSVSCRRSSLVGASLGFDDRFLGDLETTEHTW